MRLSKFVAPYRVAPAAGADRHARLRRHDAVDAARRRGPGRRGDQHRTSAASTSGAGSTSAWRSVSARLLLPAAHHHRLDRPPPAARRCAREMFAHLQKLSLRFYDNNEVGRVMSRVTSDVTSLQDLMTSGFLTILGDIVGIVVSVGFLLYFDVQLALVTFTVVPVLVVAMAVWQNYSRRAFVRVRQAIAIVNAQPAGERLRRARHPEPLARGREREALRAHQPAEPARERRRRPPHRRRHAGGRGDRRHRDGAGHRLRRLSGAARPDGRRRR